MAEKILFIQGGGDNGYTVDAKLVASLKMVLAKTFDVIYPEMKPDMAAPDFGWLGQIDTQLRKSGNNVILVAHSVGASLLLKYLSENEPPAIIRGIFLLATPFWTGKEEWEQGLMLRQDFAERLPPGVPIYFYHARDDEEITFENLSTYRHKLPGATYREIHTGGHQLNNDLTIVAKDIRPLLSKSN